MQCVTTYSVIQRQRRSTTLACTPEFLLAVNRGLTYTRSASGGSSEGMGEVVGDR